MWYDEGPSSLYYEQLPIPSAAPTDDPQVCISLNPAWVPYLAGAAMDLLQRSTWDSIDPAVLLEVIGQATDLLAIIGNAGVCMQAGTASVTISSGQSVGTAVITFPVPFASTPVVVVSIDSGLYIAGKESLTASGFTATLTARFAVGADSTDTLSWIARLP